MTRNPKTDDGDYMDYAEEMDNPCLTEKPKRRTVNKIKSFGVMF